MKSVAIVAAAGIGKRFGQDKTFFPFRGKPVLLWTLEALEGVDGIEEIIPALREEDIGQARELASRAGLRKVKRFARGGLERQDSVYNALGLVPPETDIVLVHDGARPFADAAFIKGLIAGLDGADGVVPGLMPKDTIKQVNASGFISSTPERKGLVAVQTPQVFRYDALMKAYGAAMRAGFYSTDDSALVESAGGKIKVVPGDAKNIKITAPEDIIYAEGLFKRP